MKVIEGKVYAIHHSQGYKLFNMFNGPSMGAMNSLIADGGILSKFEGKNIRITIEDLDQGESAIDERVVDLQRRVADLEKAVEGLSAKSAWSTYYVPVGVQSDFICTCGGGEPCSPEEHSLRHARYNVDGTRMKNPDGSWFWGT